MKYASSQNVDITKVKFIDWFLFEYFFVTFKYRCCAKLVYILYISSIKNLIYKRFLLFMAVLLFQV